MGPSVVENRRQGQQLRQLMLGLECCIAVSLKLLHSAAWNSGQTVGRLQAVFCKSTGAPLLWMSSIFTK